MKLQGVFTITLLFLCVLSTFVFVHRFPIFSETWSLSRPTKPLITTKAASEHSSSLLSGDSRLAIFNPVARKELATSRLNHKCSTDLPTQKDVVELRSRKWSLSRYVLNYNVERFLTKRWRALLQRVARGQEIPAKERPTILSPGSSVLLERFSSITNVTETKYPGDDLHALRFANGSFDVVYADQVLEHVLFPHLAVLEIHRVLKRGGLAILTTCAYNPVHDRPGKYHDLWRFQMDGLRLLSMPFEGGIRLCGSWGTAKTVSIRSSMGLLSQKETIEFNRIRNKEVQRNEELNPFSIWIAMVK